MSFQVEIRSKHYSNNDNNKQNNIEAMREREKSITHLFSIQNNTT